MGVFVSRLCLVLFSIIIVPFNLSGQNLDLHTKYYSGKYFAMAGSGAGINGGINTLDINPAGIGGSKEIKYSFSYLWTRMF